MIPLLPSPVSCHKTELPKLCPDQEASLPACKKRALTLDCRTGACILLVRSGVFVHGGLTVPLDLAEVNSSSIQRELIMYFGRERGSGNFQNLSDWISRETFFLDLITRKWEHVPTAEDIESFTEQDSRQSSSIMKGRVFHSMAYHEGFIYIFGGLEVSPQSGYELMASNELWALNLATKTWKLLSSNPSITRRFNHSMHVDSGGEEGVDALLYIVGGLNNMDRPVHVVDIYNLTQRKWDSLDDDNTEAQEIVTNINGQNTHLLQNSNFSLLIRDQVTDKPLIAMYSPVGDKDDETVTNPLVIQPLKAGPIGQRMPIFQGDQRWSGLKYKAPYNLLYPSGDYFGHNIIVSGYYPDVQSNNFHCFTYNMPTGKWTEINTMCDDPMFSTRHLWQLLVWHSHHKVVFLGTNEKNNHLPSVQKFNSILCIALPMINVFHKAFHRTVERERSTASFDQLPTGQDAFDDYSRYSAPPLQITTITSVFPSHAMALGKDSLELCKQHLSDFEIVTEDGDSVRVPVYLLRKRWGRYFDQVLAHGYVKASCDFESRNRDNEFSKFSTDSAFQSGTPTRHHFDSSSSRGPVETSSQGSMEGIPYKGELLQEIHPLLASRKSVPLFFANKSTSNLKTESKNKDDAFDASNRMPQVAPILHHSKSDSSAVCSSNASSKGSKGPTDHIKGTPASGNDSTVASLSGGLVFRLPFQEGSRGAVLSTPLVHDASEKQAGMVGRRKSSTSTPHTADGGQQGSRRASHPIFIKSEEKSGLPATMVPQSPFGSRKASVTSQNSSISFVSSASDRMGNPAHRRTSQDSGMTSSTLNSLSSQIPPLQPMPSEPVPVAPHHLQNDAFSPARYSPFSSRRSSLYHEFLRPGLSNTVSQSLLGIHENLNPESASIYEVDPHSIRKRSLDRQLLEDNLIDVELEASLNTASHKQPDSKNKGKSRRGSCVKTLPQAESNRPSYLSMAESGATFYENSIGDVEPLLLPRSLYMPWPTTTIRSFVEFFYTGQVNGRWLLSPVALNLLVMAKTYEIPLLYDLMSEALYSILGKKEESLVTTGDALKQLFLVKHLRAHDGNEEESKRALESHAIFNKFLEFEQSLQSIDNGFFDTNLLKSMTRQGSGVSTESASTTKPTAREDREGASLNVPLLFSGHPKESLTSLDGHLATSGSPEVQLPKNDSKAKKSSLSKDVPSISYHRDPENYNEDGSVTTARRNTTDRENKADKLEQQTLSNLSQNEESEFSDRIIDLKHSNREGFSERETPTAETSKPYKESSVKLPENESNSSSESDLVGTGFGLSSSSKIFKKLRRRGSERPIDPLSKTSGSEGSSLKNIIEYFKKGDKFSKPDNNSGNVDTLTLANMASADSLPPVDYVIELIHETAILVHDVRLIVRCVSVIKLSKRLKLLKQQLDYEMTLLDNEALKHRSSTDIMGHLPTAVKVGDALPTTSSPTLDRVPRAPSSVGLNKRSLNPVNPESPVMSGLGSESNARSASSDQSLAETDSVSLNTKSSRQHSKPPVVKRVNSHMATSGLSGAAYFMAGSLVPTVPKGKKDSTSSSGKGGISFFGKRK
ncbi:LADA_0G03466g1_1 [Lachancea dasiensis]|uniref:LADA_0G03466g1_1 n=1 Tax=Lachancea dasiensis TaxID=1072105 RepID=A0A1G4JRQ6_9SACH|nr:LADA_0G03466g1_1 [Lachancea dasiensis]